MASASPARSDAQPRESHARLVAALVACTLVPSLSQSVIIPALPQLAEALHVSLAGAVWTVTAYLLTASAGTPLVGRIGDGIGVRRTMLAVLALYVAGSVLALARHLAGGDDRGPPAAGCRRGYVRPVDRDHPSRPAGRCGGAHARPAVGDSRGRNGARLRARRSTHRPRRVSRDLLAGAGSRGRRGRAGHPGAAGVAVPAGSAHRLRRGSSARGRRRSFPCRRLTRERGRLDEPADAGTDRGRTRRTRGLGGDRDPRSRAPARHQPAHESHRPAGQSRDLLHRLGDVRTVRPDPTARPRPVRAGRDRCRGLYWRPVRC